MFNLGDNNCTKAFTIKLLVFIESSCPIDACCIRVEIKKDSILSKILNFVTEGFPTEVMDKDMIPYFRKQSEL